MEKINFELIKDLDEEVGVKEHKWYGTEDQTEDKYLHDTGQGDTVIMRFFPYKMRPDLEKPPTREELLTPEYIRHLKTLLWADGLKAVTEPTVKIEKDSFTIGVACHPAAGQVVTEKPKYLQEWLN